MNKNNANNFLKYLLIVISSAVIGSAVVFATLYYVFFSHVFNIENANDSNATAVAHQSLVTTKTDAQVAYKKVKPTVVTVQNYQTQSTNTDIFSQWITGNENETTNTNPELTSEGSGVAFKKADGFTYIVTNYHVVENAQELEIITNDNKNVKAELVGVDQTTDLAVLKVDSNDLKDTIDFADSNNLKVGSPVFAIGSPLGSSYSSSITAGIISATDRKIQQGNIDVNAIQTDTALNSGNSGGALVDAEGKLIGINSMKITESASTSVEGMGFAIPSNTVQEVTNRILSEQ